MINSTWLNLKGYGLGENSLPTAYILCSSIYVIAVRESEVVSGVLGRCGTMEGQHTGDVGVIELFHMLVIMVFI